MQSHKIEFIDVYMHMDFVVSTLFWMSRLFLREDVPNEKLPVKQVKNTILLRSKPYHKSSNLLLFAE